MATGGERNEVWILSATRSPKNSGSMLKVFNSGRKIGMKMTMISVHSSGQPSTKMVNWARTMNPGGDRLSASTNFSTGSWAPRKAENPGEREGAKKSQQTNAVGGARKKKG